MQNLIFPSFLTIKMLNLELAERSELKLNAFLTHLMRYIKTMKSSPCPTNQITFLSLCREDEEDISLYNGPARARLHYLTRELRLHSFSTVARWEQVQRPLKALLTIQTLVIDKSWVYNTRHWLVF